MRVGIAMVGGLAVAGAAFGTTAIRIDKEDITATQAIVRVSTDQPGFCVYRVSEESNLSALVNDVNPSLFSGANSDARRGSIVSGGTHVFVAGTRTAARAENGKLYSRSLQTNTLHWVGVTCGEDAEVSSNFRTANLPLGNDAPELMPFDVRAFGNVAVPTMDWTNRSTTYNDPLWGTQLHRMTDLGDLAFYAAENKNYNIGVFTYALSSGGNWANASNALSADSSRLATCNTTKGCTTKDKLNLIAVIPRSATNYAVNGAWDPTVSFLDFLVRVWGSGTDGSEVNRTVAVCWSIDNQTCFTTSQNVVLPKSAAFAGTAPRSWSVQSPWSGARTTTLTNIVVANGTATVNFAAADGLSAGGQICVNGIRDSISVAQGGNGLNGCHTIVATPTTNSLTFASNASSGTYRDSELIASPNFPQSQWASWGHPPLHNAVGSRSGGTVTATSGALVLSSSEQSTSTFDPTWVPGTKIYVVGSAPMCADNLCTVSTTTDAQHLTLVERLTISGAEWSSANFSLLVKKTTGTGAVSLSAGYDFVYGANYNSGLDGSGDICNSNFVTVKVDADGNPISPSLQGYLCVATTHTIANANTPIYLFVPSTGETRLIARTYQANDYQPWIGWHPTDGTAWFIHRRDHRIFKVVYKGDFRSLTPGFPQSATEAGTPERLTFTDIFAGAENDMSTQMAKCADTGTCKRAIDPKLFSVPPLPPQTGAAIRGNYMVLCNVVSGGGQNSPGYITLWDVGGIPGKLAWAGYTFDAFPVGYAGLHACLSFGTGQFNWNGLVESAGELTGTMQGPWQATPKMYDRGRGFTADTSVDFKDGFECPERLSEQWQALGAKPVAQGGVARCLRFKVAGDFCSNHATAAESAAYPCPWNPAPNYSLIKPIAEGDSIGDAAAGFTSYGERMLVVKVTRNSATDIDLLVYRYSSHTVTPQSNFTCGTYGASEWDHANGWTMRAYPYFACGGSNYWIDAADSKHGFTVENPGILGAHSDFGEGSSGYTYVEGATLNGYITRANEPMPRQIGSAPTAQITANPTFGSKQLPDIFMQSYPSKRQQKALTSSAEMDWALDVRHYNPSAGSAAETAQSLFGNKVSLVSGRRNTYLITLPHDQQADPKITGFVGWAGYHMLADASGPGSAKSFGDATPWNYCYALASGECVDGSRARQMYVSVPFDFSSGQCTVNSYAYNAPCVSNNYPYGFWVTQFDTTESDKTGVASRRLTSAFVAPGRQYNFTNAKPSPDGKWALVQAQWLEGQRTELFWVKLPPFPSRDAELSAPGPRPVQLHFDGVAGDAIRVAFGYAENGNAAAFHCTSRAEACFTSLGISSPTPSSTSAAATLGNGLRYASERQVYTECGKGCTITIPGVPGRALYYQVERRNASHNTTKELGVVAVQ